MMGYEYYSIEDFLTDESFQRYCSGTDEAAVDFWNIVLKQHPEIETRFTEAVQWYRLLSANAGDLQQQADRLQQRIDQVSEQNSRESDQAFLTRQPFYKRWWVAAAVVLILGVSGYLLIRQEPKNQVVKTNPQPLHLQNDMAPGDNKAILTLADGSQMILDTANNGALTRQGAVTIMKLDGQLAYQSPISQPLDSSTIPYNTITTPKGGQYQVVLSDGTSVWLNSGSSLRFPAAFSDRERKVEMTGEAYFEVAHRAAQPFIVTRGNAEIRVLGTHFNVMAYDDEPQLKITLLQGSVRISKGSQARVLKPGEQATIEPASSEINIANDVDMDHVVSWKNGLFDFDDEPLPVVMRQLARWYNADVSYSGAIPEGHYTGSIRRQARLSEVLKMLELAGNVHFSIEGKRIIVQKSD